jgi:hypothetical protein
MKAFSQPFVFVGVLQFDKCVKRVLCDFYCRKNIEVKGSPLIFSSFCELYDKEGEKLVRFEVRCKNAPDSKNTFYLFV